MGEHCHTCLLRRAIAIVALGLATACEPASFKAAKAAVSRDMRDPMSTQFRDVVQGDGDIVCGEVNAKNTMGAYVGFTRFIVSDSLGVELESEDRKLNSARWRLWCESASITTAAEHDSLMRQARAIDSAWTVVDRLLNPL